MTTHVVHLQGESLDTIRSLATSAFLDGECYAFAIALNRNLGWPIIGLMDDNGIPRHALVHSRSHGILFDVRGSFTVHEQELGRPFSFRPPYNLQKLTENDLLRVRPVHERTISYALRMAEIIMPDLPWKESRMIRARQFCDELETLCRKHGFWIRSPVPTARPILCETADDEDGYTLRWTDCGMQFIIDRRLKGEAIQ